ncbi:Tll0287-like domain-containing protein [Hydrogenophilus thiooxidans]|uniref:Tll0287-like domain-containing protein n=1 Tax=Hydrogenophilus thiooxidans TaxID=2820326 RepID=UPI001C21B9E7|nr:DUF3365 domain-containing protein [Hydrogenophilus thiooxidans]
MRSIYAVCAAIFAGSVVTRPAFADELEAWRNESRAVTQALVNQLGGELKKALAAGGPPQAIPVCSEIAPKIVSALSAQYGWQVRRVSLKVRNPLIGMPDAWEQRQLAEFDRRVAAGEKAEGLEVAEVVSEPAGRYFRYMKALPVGSLCLNCHGSDATVSSETAAALAANYPHDRARGYREGEVRGAVSIKRPLE